MGRNLNYIEILKAVSIVIFLALPPWFAMRKYLKNYISRALLIITFIAYIAATIFTQNVIPFIAVILTFYFAVKMKDNDEMLYYLRPLESKKEEIILYSFAFKFFTMIINIFFVMLLYKFGIKAKEQDIYNIFLKSGWGQTILLVIMTVVTAPIVEEFVFRHILYRGFKKKIGNVFSAILSSLLFTLLHFNIAGSISYFAVGIFNCYLYEKYGYRAAVINHFVFNFISVLMIILMKAFKLPNVV
ncbi:CAAX protease self-immunity [Caloramator quimbayensis]|uniref:CAAX protease self-immunity n=1 Tax=Caloramator quimbayensis TaxID=1147123 RepID=A0A1T4XKR5_9CLOT|nr:CPBP family intramembrane glutamic endopeptidase [Caloramator quimbayensis]SKA90140.1 CAAX protease self-immunity [Caloramator quimbayensis]